VAGVRSRKPVSLKETSGTVLYQRRIGADPIRFTETKTKPMAMLNKLKEPNEVSVRSAIISQFQIVAEEQGRKLSSLSDDIGLVESGLDSLCLAIIVARLEDQLGFDPFSSDEDADLPVTLGDFIAFYEDAAK
jgi:acyl carrier protein